MKKNYANMAALAALMTLTLQVNAAQDGLLDTVVSTGQFVNTLGLKTPIDRMVQVIGVKDALVKRSSPALTIPSGSPNLVGVRDDFCVVDTAKSTVKLSFTNFRNGGWVATSITGSLLGYRLLVAPTVTAALADVAAGGSVNIAAATSVASAADCGTGNVSKGVVADVTTMNASPNVTFVDSVIITATPI